MICREFERWCNERLDAREGESRLSEAGRALESHAAGCPTCKLVALQYEVLGRAIRALGPPPEPPGGFASRLLERWEPSSGAPTPWARRLWAWGGVAAAA